MASFAKPFTAHLIYHIFLLSPKIQKMTLIFSEQFINFRQLYPSLQNVHVLVIDKTMFYVQLCFLNLNNYFCILIFVKIEYDRKMRICMHFRTPILYFSKTIICFFFLFSSVLWLSRKNFSKLLVLQNSKSNKNFPLIDENRNVVRNYLW